VVIDSSVLMALYLKEAGYETVLAKIANATVVVIGAPTLLETAMVLSSRTRQDARLALMTALRRLRVEVVPWSEEHYDVAAEAFLRYGKGRHPAGLSFGDCMSYAVAAVSGLPLLYAGEDFAQTDVVAA
jgi:ribonuclease VapC